MCPEIFGKSRKYVYLYKLPKKRTVKQKSEQEGKRRKMFELKNITT